jgi:hypothetical protein
VEFVSVGDTHEVAVPRGLKVQAPEPDFEPSWEGVRAAHGYSVRITIEMAGGKLISTQFPCLARQLLVRKVVPTLTSKSAEIYLSMAGAKQHNDMRFILILTAGRTSSRGALGRCIAVHRGARRGELQARRERRRSLQIPEGLLRQSANTVDEGGKVRVGSYPSSPRSQETSSSYKPRGNGLQSCCTTLSATYGGMAHSVMELIVVLVNLASGGRRGESCARLGAASRVAAWDLLVWSPSVRRLEGWADGGPHDA